MNADLATLRSVMPPPAHGCAVDWDRVRAETGWMLPEDYREFVALYGMGVVSDSLSILTPPFPGQPPGEDMLYRISFPPANGLLVWGSNEGGDDLLWRCAGHPDDWTVVLHSRNHGSFDFPMGMVAFLSAVTSGRLKPRFSARLLITPPRWTTWREDFGLDVD